MRKVYMVADNIFSPLGKTTAENIDALKKGISGIQQHTAGMSAEPFYAALFHHDDRKTDESKTLFEQIVYASASEAIRHTKLDLKDGKTGFILSSTKGNISLIENVPDGTVVDEKRISLNTSAGIVADALGFTSIPMVVSHACISGLLAMISGMRLIQSGLYDHLVITGADLITSFIYSGFRSFQAISPNPCKPFDAARDGINLGEAAATVVLSVAKTENAVLLSGGAVSNDANHISGPSRTGEELWLAIRSALEQSGIGTAEIDFISAHGTATRYNDEMESKAFNLASMQNTPVNSLKGYYGHTLGAAGILESIVTIQSMKENMIFPTMGFQISGTEMPVEVVKEFRKSALNKCLKTASGFGGCNAAVVMMKE